MQLEGSSVAKAANDRFDATMTNIVTWHDPPTTGRFTKELESNAIIQVRNFKQFPEHSGSTPESSESAHEQALQALRP